MENVKQEPDDDDGCDEINMTFTGKAKQETDDDDDEDDESDEINMISMKKVEPDDDDDGCDEINVTFIDKVQEPDDDTKQGHTCSTEFSSQVQVIDNMDRQVSANERVQQSNVHGEYKGFCFCSQERQNCSKCKHVGKKHDDKYLKLEKKDQFLNGICQYSSKNEVSDDSQEKTSLSGNHSDSKLILQNENVGISSNSAVSVGESNIRQNNIEDKKCKQIKIEKPFFL